MDACCLLKKKGLRAFIILPHCNSLFSHLNSCVPMKNIFKSWGYLLCYMVKSYFSVYFTISGFVVLNLYFQYEFFSFHLQRFVCLNMNGQKLYLPKKSRYKTSTSTSVFETAPVTIARALRQTRTHSHTESGTSRTPDFPQR